MKLPRLLAISDGSTPLSHWEPWLEDLAAAGIAGLWVRERALADADLLRTATLCRRVLPDGVQVLVSGRLDLAVLAGADGVHLAATGLPLPPLRRLAERLGVAVLLGRSTHTLAEVAAAKAEGADYVTFGPVYATASKAIYGPPRGLEELERAVRLDLPVVALGGLDAESVGPVLATGVAGVAALGAFRSTSSARSLARAVFSKP